MVCQRTSDDASLISFIYFYIQTALSRWGNLTRKNVQLSTLSMITDTSVTFGSLAPVTTLHIEPLQSPKTALIYNHSLAYAFLGFGQRTCARAPLRVVGSTNSARPLCHCMMRLTMASPNPKPPVAEPDSADSLVSARPSLS